MSNREIAERIMRKVSAIGPERDKAIDRLIAKELPMPSCLLKREKVLWDRARVREMITTVPNGPTEFK